MNTDLLNANMSEEVALVKDTLKKDPDTMEFIRKIVAEDIAREYGPEASVSDEVYSDTLNGYIEEMALVETVMNDTAIAIYNLMTIANLSAAIIEDKGLKTLSEAEILLAIKHKVIAPLFLSEDFYVDLCIRGMHANPLSYELTKEDNDEIIKMLINGNQYSIFAEDDPALKQDFILSGIGYKNYNGKKPVGEKAIMDKKDNVVQFTLDETGTVN